MQCIPPMLQWCGCNTLTTTKSMVLNIDVNLGKEYGDCEVGLGVPSYILQAHVGITTQSIHFEKGTIKK